jgi:hypothetical protein
MCREWYGNHNENLVIDTRVLKLHAAAERTYMVSQVKTTGWAVAGKYNLAHNFVFFNLTAKARINEQKGKACFDFLLRVPKLLHL